ncbi:MAG: hypothetical protein AAF557_00865 [Pseudomonadota bacterium]
MVEHTEIAPVLSCRFVGGAGDIPKLVEDLLGAGGLAGLPSLPTPETLEILGLALNEVLHSITEISGRQTVGDASSVELWVEETLVILCVRFRGAPLPDWLLQNWDRAQEPAVLAPSIDCGWGWLLVREALDAVSHGWRGSEQLLFLEKRV